MRHASRMAVVTLHLPDHRLPSRQGAVLGPRRRLPLRHVPDRQPDSQCLSRPLRGGDPARGLRSDTVATGRRRRKPRRRWSCSAACSPCCCRSWALWSRWAFSLSPWLVRLYAGGLAEAPGKARDHDPDESDHVPLSDADLSRRRAPGGPQQPRDDSCFRRHADVLQPDPRRDRLVRGSRGSPSGGRSVDRGAGRGLPAVCGPGAGGSQAGILAATPVERVHEPCRCGGS